MIQISPRLSSLMQSASAEIFYTVKIDTFLFTSYHRDLDLMDGRYLATSLIAGVEPPKSDSSVDRNLYRVALNDNDLITTSLYENGLIGAPLVVKLGFVDPDTGAPEIHEMFLVYDGIIQGFEQSFKTEEFGEVSSVVIGSNTMAALDATRSFIVSREALREIDPSDRAFDQIYEGSSRVILDWGKK